MNFLKSLLGNLPAAESAAMSLNKIDILKIVRVIIMAFLGAFLAQLLIPIKECVVAAMECNLTFADAPSLLADAGYAGYLAVTVAVTETVRRFFAS